MVNLIEDYTENSKRKANISKNYSNKKYGEMAIILDFVDKRQSTYKKNFIEFNNAIEKELSKEIFTPKTLCNDKKIIETRQKLKKVNQLINNYNEKAYSDISHSFHIFFHILRFLHT